MRRAIAIGLCLLAVCLLTVHMAAVIGADAKEPEFKLDNYAFIWYLAKSGDAEIRIQKTQDATSFILSTGTDFVPETLFLKPAAAEALGRQLARADQYAQQWKGSDKDVQERVKADGYAVTFFQRPEHGLSVQIAPDERFTMTRLVFDRKQARDLSPYLTKASRMIAFVEQQVRIGIPDKEEPAK